MNANRRFLISFVAYLAYFVLLVAAMGTSNSYLEAHPSLTTSGPPEWAGVLVFAGLLVWPMPALLYFFTHTPVWKKEVQKHGRLAPALILTTKDTGVSNGDDPGSSFYVDLTVRVSPQDEAAFEGEFGVLASRMGVPSPGEVILVRYDPADRRHIAPARDMGALGAVSMVRDVVPDLSALTASMSSGRAGALANELRELEDMHRSGSLTEQEFRTARKKLLA